MNRMTGYCHQTLLNVSWQQLVSHEGRLDSKHTSDNLELVHTHVMVRHGDRTPVYSYKIGYPIFYECGLIDTRVNWDGLKDFPKLVPLPPSAKLNNRYLKLHPGATTRRCDLGMLTEMGFKQHFSVGYLLQTRYRHFLGDFSSGHFSPRDVFVHSTDIPRTIQSAAAFLLGFLPDSSSIRRATRIHVSPGTVNHKPPPGIEKVYPSCHGYYDFLEADLKKSGYFKTEKTVFHPKLARLCKMFHIPYPSQPIVARLFDHFLTRGCHKGDDPLPCFREQCVDFPYALQLFDFSDWNWSHKLPTNSSTLRLLPFLRHSVLEPMLKVASSRGINSESRDEEGDDSYSFKFMLTLSHDDTITMLLNALGYRLKRWIPYASRIVFELWKSGPSSAGEYYVRVLFNGKMISNETLPGGGGGTKRFGGELIRLDNWRDFLTTGNYRDLTSYNRVCGN